jgi:hypothetical protein
MEEMIGGWRKLNNWGLHNVFFPQDVTRTIDSKRIRWIGHIACMEEK